MPRRTTPFWSSALLLVLLTAVPATALPPSGAIFLCEAYDGDGVLIQLNPATGNTVSSTPMVIDGLTVDSCHGLAFKPGTSQLYAILNLDNPPGRNDGERVLAVMNPETAVGTQIGEIGENAMSEPHVSLVFSNDGSRLFTTGGSSCSSPCDESIHEVDQLTGAATLLIDVASGESKKSVAVGPDGHLYFSGEDRILRVDSGSLAITELNNLDQDDMDDAMTWDPTRGAFLGIDRTDLYTMDTTGDTTYWATTDADISYPRGMAVFQGPSVLEIPSLSAVGTSLFLLLLAGVGVLRMRQG